MIVFSEDLRNAFNGVSRSAILRADSGIKHSNYTQWAYDLHFILRFGIAIIYSACGVWQGDFAEPVQFAMAPRRATFSMTRLFR